MSDEKFTKGEWKINKRPHGKVSIVGESGQQVCLMWNSNYRNGNCDLITTAGNAAMNLKKMGYDPLKIFASISEIIGAIEESCEASYLTGKDIKSMKEKINE